MENQVLVVTGETGSGKSTQLPKICLESDHGHKGIIGCTQPRRIAAITLANRVAEELGSEGGPYVGYKIRFQDRTARHTRIKFMTDGILLAEAQRDRLFRGYGTLIIDEAHERTLNIDFLLGLIKRILPRRPDLKVIITSATIDPERFSRAFNNAPIIEVSGRTYPVEVWYRPPEVSPPEISHDEEGEVGHIEQAVACVDLLKGRRDSRSRGDVLIFMPTESDIRETVQRLEEKGYFNTVVLPLFGRLTALEQQRVFENRAEEKIVVATNVAETSITIPRIRYVIDTGLARISQYNPRSRTQGLPVVPISQASANQRKGRCGRVKAGICIRLYSEEDYLNRPLHTPPEIQRSNLAEVILRMLCLKLGNVMDFPFIDPPSSAAVKDGFAVLTELGAVDQNRKITPVGRTMASLPLDPRLSRMIIQARNEGALREVVILAAALSIQDCRERPLELEAQADQAHAPFKDSRSDFVSLLKIWNTFWKSPWLGAWGRGSEKESGSGGELPGNDNAPSHRSRFSSWAKMRKFCKENFVSYKRIREWRDIQEEISDVLNELGGFEWNEQPASYEAIHRSVVSGYLSHVAMRRDKNLYMGIRHRQLMVFPGSAVFHKGAGWIVAAEQVHTSRLFARTIANIESSWLEDLGAHLCRSTFSEPHWERRRGQVVAWEKVTLYGLPIVERRKVNYGRINPGEAREIFIRSALVEGDLPPRYGFLEHNRRLVEGIEELESKTRRRDLLLDDEAIFDFYDRKLPEFSDLRSFDRFLKVQREQEGGEAFLHMTMEDLLRTPVNMESLEQFPDTLVTGEQVLPLEYCFEPGTEEDGVTVVVPVHLIPQLNGAFFSWLVPGLLLEKVTLLLKALPKSMRKQLVPVSETAGRLTALLDYRTGDLHSQLSRLMGQHFGVSVPLDAWNEGELPPFLRLRFKVVDLEGNVLGAGRDFEEITKLNVQRQESPLWQKARRIWEREQVDAAHLNHIPRRVELGADSLGIVHYAHSGLVEEEERVALRLFEDPLEARRATLRGLAALYRRVFASELKQLKRGWVFPEGMGPFLFFMGSRTLANGKLQNYLMREIFDLHDPQEIHGGKFEDNVKRLGGSLGAQGAQLIQEIFPVVEERGLARAALERFQASVVGGGLLRERIDLIMEQLKTLVPPDFLDHYRREQIRELPRLLKGLRIRSERAYAAPEKDLVKEKQIMLHLNRYEEMEAAQRESSEEGRRIVSQYRWMLEELKVNTFAPEVKAKMKVSPGRLEEKWQEWLLWRKKQNP